MISTINFQRLQLAQKCTNENITGDKSIRGVKLGIPQRSSNVVTTCCIQDVLYSRHSSGYQVRYSPRFSLCQKTVDENVQGG